MPLESFPKYFLVALLTLPLVSTSIARPALAEERISPEARAYFRNGVELLQNNPPNYQDAYYQFKLAYAKSKSWKVLGNLGLCAVKLERDNEALDAYAEYLRRGGEEIAKEEREAIERDVLLIRGNGATVELTSRAPALEVRDVRLGASVAPHVHQLVEGKKTLFVRAGTHEFTASTPSGERRVWTAVLEPGKSARHEFDFEAPAQETPAQPAEPLAPPPAPDSRDSLPRPSESGGGVSLRTVGFVTVGVGVAALGGSGITWLLAKGKESQAIDKCDPVTNLCDPEAEALFDDSASLARTTNVLLIGGGVVSAVGLGLVIFGAPANDSARASRLRILPVFGQSSSALLASGVF